MKIKRVSTPELKILIVFFYFFIFDVTSLTGFTIASQNIAEFESELTSYFICESQGIQADSTCERGFNRMGTEIALIFVYTLLGFFPVISLVYVINYQEIKEKCLRWFADGGGAGETSGTT